MSVDAFELLQVIIFEVVFEGENQIERMATVRFTLMGCGGSAGVPLGANWWGDCDPNEPKNRRQRSAAFIQSDTTDILIDAGPDVRNQLISLDHQKIDHLILTHEHSDHVAG